ncbi:efflux RND transporter periplasmic adaptor subunit [Crateriforma conspicua]|uniref:Macrolide transporter subunit MacA n=1 Tax=Crateriforma conspicua TaxID=2527996 RepID=A0A5C5XZN3_9PLAN|nr:efflux RND transporter periplasmic adaptor subunit [Crateriforma conspicua]TWT68450.1 macrolide transporter subunit MacA [Crateriforma conspicua]
MRLSIMLPAIAWLLCTSMVRAEGVRGFSEPYRRVMVSASEMGTLAAIDVVEGQHVQRDQVLGQLDDRVLQASLKIAQAAKDAEGAMRAAKIDLEIKKRHLEGFVELSQAGNASVREVERAQADYDQALARVQAAEEQILLRQLEYDRTIQQIEQRRVRSPFDGIVTEIIKRPGEFVSPTDPVIFEVVQLDTLRCNLTIPNDQIQHLRLGMEVKLVVGQRQEPVTAMVEYIAPVVDPQSGTVLVKLRIPNSSQELKAGLVCRLDLPGDTRTARLLRTR